MPSAVLCAVMFDWSLVERALVSQPFFSVCGTKCDLPRTTSSLDLRPEGYKLIKFKEEVLDLLSEGTLEHTITAFWEYLLLLEVCHKILEKDRVPHTRNQKLYTVFER